MANRHYDQGHSARGSRQVIQHDTRRIAMHILLIAAAALQVTDAGTVTTTKTPAHVVVQRSSTPMAPRHTVQKPAVKSVSTAAFDLFSVESNIIAKTNSQRVRNGKSPLTMDESLMRSARQHCSWMAKNRTMQHTRASVAENIAMGQSSSGEAVQDWMSSPGHRANMLSGEYTRIGVAAYRGRDGRVYWCQQFLR